MNSRNSWRWAVSAALLFALILVQHRFLRKPPPGPIHVLSSFEPASVKSIQISRPAGRVEIRADRTNSEWLLTRPLSYPGRAAKIDTLLTNLSGLVPVTIIGPEELRDRPKADEEFGFANPQASILMDLGQKKLHLLVGAVTGPGDQLYVQSVGGEAVYVVGSELLKIIPSSASEWRDTALLDLKSPSFSHVTVTNAGKVYVEFQRLNTSSPWRMLRPFVSRADSGKLDFLLEGLRTMRVSQFVSDDPKTDLEPLGLQHPELELSLAEGTNILAILQFGKTNNQNQIYARRFGESSVVSVPKELINPWRAPINDFRDQHLFTSTAAVHQIDVRGEDTFTLQRQPNDTWLVLPQHFEADTGLVTNMLSLLSAMHIDFYQDVVPDSGLPEKGLAPPRREYKLLSSASNSPSNNSLVVHLQFGLQTNGVLVRRTDENSVYSINTNDFAQLPGASWQFRDRRIWAFNENDIAGAIIKKDGKTTQILRKEIYKWTIAPGSQGLIKNELALEETMRDLARVSALAWVGSGKQSRITCGITDTSLQVTLDLKSGKKASIQFGGEASPVSVYACVQLADQPMVFEFPWSLFRDLLTSLPVSLEDKKP